MRLVRLLTTLVITMVLGTLVAPSLGCASNSTAANPSLSPQRQAATVKRGDIASYITAVGTLAFANTRDLTFSLSGRIVEVNAKYGDIVKKGQVLARYDYNDKQKALDAAELDVKSAEIDVQDAKDAEADITSAQIDLDQAVDSLRKLTYPYTYATFAFDVPKAVDSINNALRQVEEARKVMQAGITPEQYSEASRQLKMALDNLTDAQQALAHGYNPDVLGRQSLAVKDFWTLRAAQLAVDKAQSTLDKTKSSYKSGLDQANVALQEAINDRDTAKEDLAKGIIVAPFDAVVTMVNVYRGDEWKSGQVAFTVAELDKFEADVVVPEADITSVKEGQKTTLQLDVVGATVSGTVTQIALTDSTYQGTVGYKVRIMADAASIQPAKPAPARTPLDNNIGEKPGVKPVAITLREGLLVTVNMLKEERKGVLLVPTPAVSRQGGKTSVQVTNGTVTETRVVNIGLSDAQNTEITQGLSEGDKVLLPVGATPARPGNTR